MTVMIIISTVSRTKRILEPNFSVRFSFSSPSCVNMPSSHLPWSNSVWVGFPSIKWFGFPIVSDQRRYSYSSSNMRWTERENSLFFILLLLLLFYGLILRSSGGMEAFRMPKIRIADEEWEREKWNERGIQGSPKMYSLSFRSEDESHASRGWY